jgi:hypothetical protein
MIQARYLAERARISVGAEEKANLPADVINSFDMSVAPTIEPSTALSALT